MDLFLLGLELHVEVVRDGSTTDRLQRSRVGGCLDDLRVKNFQDPDRSPLTTIRPAPLFLEEEPGQFVTEQSCVFVVLHAASIVTLRSSVIPSSEATAFVT